MDTQRQSNKPLLLSMISIMVCIALLIGATLAWFTDTQTNTGNRIQAGTLDIELYKYIGDEDPVASNDDVSDKSTWVEITNDSDENAVFGDLFENWQPGQEETIYLAVKNAGSLELDYTLDIVVTNEALADALHIGICTAETAPTGFSYEPYVSMSSLMGENDMIEISTNGMEVETTQFVAVNIKLDESTGNTYQDLEFEMDLVLTATQKEVPETIVKAYDIDDVMGAEENQTVILMGNIDGSGKDVSYEYPVNIDLNGYTLYVKKLTIESEDYATIDIDNGTIKSTEDVTITLPKGSVNITDSVIATNGFITLDASNNTLSLSGTTKFLDLDDNVISVTILEDTRVVADLEDNVTVLVDAETTGVVIEHSEGSNGTVSVSGEGTEKVEVDGVMLELINSSEDLISFITAETEKTGYLNSDILISNSTSGSFQMELIEDKSLNLNGHTLTLEYSNFIIREDEPITLTLYNSSEEGAIITDSRVARIEDEGILIVDNCIIYSNDGGNKQFFQTYGDNITLTFTNSTFTDGKFNFDDDDTHVYTSFDNCVLNSGDNFSGAIISNEAQGSLTISNSTFNYTGSYSASMIDLTGTDSLVMNLDNVSFNGSITSKLGTKVSLYAFTAYDNGNVIVNMKDCNANLVASATVSSSSNEITDVVISTFNGYGISEYINYEGINTAIGAWNYTHGSNPTIVTRNTVINGVLTSSMIDGIETIVD